MPDPIDLAVEHTEDCVAVGAADCQPAEGVWLQPPGSYVMQATDELGDDAPWCQIQTRAFELEAEEQ